MQHDIGQRRRQRPAWWRAHGPVLLSGRLQSRFAAATAGVAAAAEWLPAPLAVDGLADDAVLVQPSMSCGAHRPADSRGRWAARLQAMAMRDSKMPWREDRSCVDCAAWH